MRKRSVPVKLDAKMSRKAAIITGNISETRGTVHAYVVFHEEPAALAALASNMHLVGPWTPSYPTQACGNVLCIGLW